MNARALRSFGLLPLLLVAGCSGGGAEPPPAPSSGLANVVQEGAPIGSSGKSGSREDTHGFAPFKWHDGVRERTAWMDPARVADHAPDAASRARLLALDPAASADEPAEGSPRLWQLGLTAGDPRALCDAASLSGPGRFSPLFRDNPSESSPARSLPGGVVLGFQDSWTNERARAWLASRELEIAQELALAAPTFVVASPAGLATLELANELRVAPELRLAHPNWWVAAAPY